MLNGNVRPVPSQDAGSFVPNKNRPYSWTSSTSTISSNSIFNKSEPVFRLNDDLSTPVFTSNSSLQLSWRNPRNEMSVTSPVEYRSSSSTMSDHETWDEEESTDGSRIYPVRSGDMATTSFGARDPYSVSSEELMDTVFDSRSPIIQPPESLYPGTHHSTPGIIIPRHPSFQPPESLYPGTHHSNPRNHYTQAPIIQPPESLYPGTHHSNPRNHYTQAPIIPTPGIIIPRHPSFNPRNHYTQAPIIQPPESLYPGTHHSTPGIIIPSVKTYASPPPQESTSAVKGRIYSIVSSV